MTKPERINEVQWAKRGWSRVGRERVGCVGGCGRELVVNLGDEPKVVSGDGPPDESEDQEDEDDWREQAKEQLVEKYAEMIVTEHESGCLWRRRGCDSKATFSGSKTPGDRNCRHHLPPTASTPSNSP